MCIVRRPTRRQVPALVDSGADGSSLPLRIAQGLGVEYDPARRRVASGAGGEFLEYVAEHDVALESELGTLTLKTPSLNAELPFILLGRQDFFEGRRVCFDQRRLRMEIVDS